MSKEIEYIDKQIEKIEHYIANPTEYTLISTIKVKIDVGAVYKEELATLNTIKATLLKAEKLEKAWEVIRKNVNVEIDYDDNRDISVALVLYIGNDKKVYIIDQATKEKNPEHFKELENLKEMLE